ncbi:MAG: hypothetical protein ACREIH_04145, partial [Nitrospiraceae bacterium]
MRTPMNRTAAQMTCSVVLIMITGCASQTVSSTHEQSGEKSVVEERVAPEPVAPLAASKTPSTAGQSPAGAFTPFFLDIPFNFDQSALRS